MALSQLSPSVSGVCACEACMWMSIHGIPVCGVALDAQTRCAHYHSELDRIAIKFKCCQVYYACYQCHEAAAEHAAQVWPRRAFTEHAILCGACGEALTIAQYLQCHAVCPACQARFNPGCRQHGHLYFEAGCGYEFIPIKASGASV